MRAALLALNSLHIIGKIELRKASLILMQKPSIGYDASVNSLLATKRTLSTSDMSWSFQKSSQHTTEQLLCFGFCKNTFLRLFLSSGVVFFRFLLLTWRMNLRWLRGRWPPPHWPREISAGPSLRTCALKSPPWTAWGQGWWWWWWSRSPGRWLRGPLRLRWTLDPEPCRGPLGTTGDST